MAKVDIIIALYNKEPYIARTIKSILHQEETDWHLIVVDDGSTDKSPDIVKKFADPRIELIHQQNAGPGPARNKGIELATAKYVAFLDADDEWYPWYLTNALKTINSNDVQMVANTYYQWPQRINTTAKWSNAGARPGIYVIKGDEPLDSIRHAVNFLVPWNTLLYTETARKYDGFYEHSRREEDTVFYTRVAFNEKFMIYGPPGVRFHSECCGLTLKNRPLPFEGIRKDPDSVLKYCPSQKKELMTQFVNYRILETALRWARFGLKNETQEILDNHPGTKVFKKEYQQCLKLLSYGKWFKYWKDLKCWTGPPIRLNLLRVAQALHIHEQAPPMPYK